MMKLAVAESMQKAHSYVKYRTIVTNLLKDGKSTGNEQSEALTHYSELNEVRMNRLDKKMVISEENIQKLLSLKKNYTWLVLSEGWCGDAAQILPVFNKMAQIAPNIDFKIVFRDENESLMHAFLTNGSRSIPKLIVFETETFNVLGSWGPRPKGATDLITSYKRQYGQIDETAKTELQLWYHNDKGLGTQTEITDLMLDSENLIYAKR